MFKANIYITFTCFHIISNLFDFINRYSEKIAKLSDHIYQIGVNAFKVCEDEFNVINHGDSHVNNMLFRYDSNGKPTDQIFVSTIKL